MLRVYSRSSVRWRNTALADWFITFFFNWIISDAIPGYWRVWNLEKWQRMRYETDEHPSSIITFQRQVKFFNYVFNHVPREVISALGRSCWQLCCSFFFIMHACLHASPCTFTTGILLRWETVFSITMHGNCNIWRTCKSIGIIINGILQR